MGLPDAPPTPPPVVTVVELATVVEGVPMLLRLASREGALRPVMAAASFAQSA